MIDEKWYLFVALILVSLLVGGWDIFHVLIGSLYFFWWIVYSYHLSIILNYFSFLKSIVDELFLLILPMLYTLYKLQIFHKLYYFLLILFHHIFCHTL